MKRKIAALLICLTALSFVPEHTAQAAESTCTQNTSRYRRPSGGKSQPGDTSRYRRPSGGVSTGCEKK